MSDYGSQTWLSALFGVVPIPQAYYIALCLDEPGTAMDGDLLADLEPTDSAYGRQLYRPGTSYWESNGPYLTNIREVGFPVPSQDWGYLSHFALCSTPTGGQVFAWGELYNPQFVGSGIGALIPVGALVLGLHALDNVIAV